MDIVVTGNPEYCYHRPSDTRFAVGTLPSFFVMLLCFLRRNKLEHWAIIDRSYYYIGEPHGLEKVDVFIHIDCPVARALGVRTGLAQEANNRCIWCSVKVHKAMHDLQLWRKKFGPN